MIPRARIIGIGQAAAGDDGAGLAVVERLEECGVPSDVELRFAASDATLLPLLETSAAVVLVDAVLGAPPGEVLDFDPRDLARRAFRAVSTHGLGVLEAVELARALAPEAVSQAIRVVAITIARPARHERGLSEAVAAAVPRAVARVLAIIGV